MTFAKLGTRAMRRLLLLGVALGAHTVAAMAADLGPVNVAPPVVYSWTGFTLGANVGGAWSTIQDNGLGGGNASSVMVASPPAITGNSRRSGSPASKATRVGPISPFPPDRVM
jgi:hypothetical protein